MFRLISVVKPRSCYRNLCSKSKEPENNGFLPIIITCCCITYAITSDKNTTFYGRSTQSEKIECNEPQNCTEICTKDKKVATNCMVHVHVAKNNTICESM